MCTIQIVLIKMSPILFYIFLQIWVKIRIFTYFVNIWIFLVIFVNLQRRQRLFALSEWHLLTYSLYIRCRWKPKNFIHCYRIILWTRVYSMLRSSLFSPQCMSTSYCSSGRNYLHRSYFFFLHTYIEILLFFL